MSRPFLTDRAQEALQAAIRSLESASGAEMVIAVRARTGSYLHADLTAGLMVGVAVLAGLLFLPWRFELVWFLVDPLAAGVVAGWVCSRWPGLRRRLTGAGERRERVESAARSLFVEKSIHRTRHRTGLLLYVSLLEKDAAVVADLGLEALTFTQAWMEEVEAIIAAVRGGASGEEVAASLGGLAALLASAVARPADDVDEIPDEVWVP
jgi:putative membrane protein